MKLREVTVFLTGLALVHLHAADYDNQTQFYEIPGKILEIGPRVGVLPSNLIPIDLVFWLSCQLIFIQTVQKPLQKTAFAIFCTKLD